MSPEEWHVWSDRGTEPRTISAETGDEKQPEQSLCLDHLFMHPHLQTHPLPSQTLRVWKTWEWIHSPFHKSQKGHLSYRLRIFTHLGTPAVIRVDHRDESRHLAFSPTKCSSVPGEDPIEQAKVVFECGDRIHTRIQFGGCQLCRPSNSAHETPGTN